ncbi:hypothetical protein OC834_006731 [Tilletia horrida]|nr:hypothetical protein OC834_006731 [Tilletia horrida]
MLPFEAAYLSILIIYVAFVILNKIRNRSWWLFRTELRKTGKVIIPHVHNLWTLLVGLFGIFLVTLCIGTRVALDKNEGMPHRAMALSLPWTPLCFASAYQAWSLIYADVSGQRSMMAAPSKPKSRKTISPPAWLVNGFFIFLPVVFLLGCAIPTLISDKDFEAARHLHAEWRHKYEAQAEISHEMLLDAQHIWYILIRGCNTLTIAQLCWICALIIVGSIHFPLAWKLVFDLSRHLRHLREITMTRSSYANASCPARNPSASPPSAPTSWRSRLFRTSTSIAPIETVKEDQVRSRLVTHEQESVNRAANFFPPIQPSKVIVQMPQRQADKVLIYFMVQSLTVTLGGLLFLCNLIRIVLTCVPTMEQGQPSICDKVAWDLCASTFIVLGTTTAISTLHTSFEASFAALVSGCQLLTEVTSGGANGGTGNSVDPVLERVNPVSQRPAISLRILERKSAATLRDALYDDKADHDAFHG